MSGNYCPHCMRPATGSRCPHCGGDMSWRGQKGIDLPVGTVLTGGNGLRTYQIGAARGKGGFGITYVALEINSGRRMAVKEYFPTRCAFRAGNEVDVQTMSGQEDVFRAGMNSFLEEGKMLLTQDDLSCVVHVIDYFRANGTAYLVMEYLDGVALHTQMTRMGGRIPVNELMPRLAPLMRDIGHLHQRGVIHRDISPDNIMWMPDGGLKLLDFGSARSMENGKSMTVLMKHGFSPIEQYRSKGQGPYTDVYALAATIYYCVTGVIPPAAVERLEDDALQSPTALGAPLTVNQETALLWALSLQPNARPQSMEAFAAKLYQGAPVPPQRPVTTGGNAFVTPGMPQVEQPPQVRPVTGQNTAYPYNYNSQTSGQYNNQTSGQYGGQIQQGPTTGQYGNQGQQGPTTGQYGGQIQRGPTTGQYGAQGQQGPTTGQYGGQGQQGPTTGQYGGQIQQGPTAGQYGGQGQTGGGRGGKKNTPIIIGGVAAAVVVLIAVLVIALGGNGSPTPIYSDTAGFDEPTFTYSIQTFPPTDPPTPEPVMGVTDSGFRYEIVSRNSMGLTGYLTDVAPGYDSDYIAVLTGYEGTGDAGTMPDYVEDDIPITAIADNAFAGVPMGGALLLPIHLETIGANAFQGCTDLTYIAAYSNVVTQPSSFSGCSNIWCVAVRNRNISGWKLPNGVSVYYYGMDTGFGALNSMSRSGGVLTGETDLDYTVLLDVRPGTDTVNGLEDVDWVCPWAADNLGSDATINLGDETLFPYEAFIGSHCNWHAPDGTLSDMWLLSCAAALEINNSRPSGATRMEPDIDLMYASKVRAEEYGEVHDINNRPDGSSWSSVLTELDISYSWTMGAASYNNSDYQKMWESAAEYMAETYGPAIEQSSNSTYVGQYYSRVGMAVFEQSDGKYAWWGYVIIP